MGDAIAKPYVSYADYLAGEVGRGGQQLTIHGAPVAVDAVYGPRDPAA